MAYEVTTFAVRKSGFERLRNRDEFILVASVWHGMSKDDMLDEFKSDIQACGRPDGFDYDAVRRLVAETVATVSMTDVLCYVPKPAVDCNAYMYIRDTSTTEDAE